MASKIFMGNMPELMEKIFNNLNNEFYSLYSCALVSRHWCEMSIPILWRDPFSSYKSLMFITRYFASLNEMEKLGLKKYGIIIDFANTLFDYASFLKVLNLHRLCSNVYHWIPNQSRDNMLVVNIVNLLLKIFIKSGATLSTLNLRANSIEIKPDVIYLLEQNKCFLSQLKDVTVKIDYYMERNSITNDIILLRILAKNTTKINSLEFCLFYHFNYESQQIHEFIRIIKSQERLRRFVFRGHSGLSTKFSNIISALEIHKKSLKEIELERCAYNSKFEELVNSGQLEVISIKYCEVEEKKLLRTLNSSICKISALEIGSHYSANAPYIIQILEKSGSMLQRLSLDLVNEAYSQSSLLETLITYCPNIIYLNISEVKLSTQFLKLINSLQKLQFLTLSWINEFTVRQSNFGLFRTIYLTSSTEAMEKCVMQFAKVLPPTLQYLDLRSIGSHTHIDILLDHCDAPLKKLLFCANNYKKEINALINFCTRKRTLDGVNIIMRKTICGNGGYVEKLQYSNELDGGWYKIKKDLEGYVKLIPYVHIVVNLV